MCTTGDLKSIGVDFESTQSGGECAQWLSPSFRHHLCIGLLKPIMKTRRKASTTSHDVWLLVEKDRAACDCLAKSRVCSAPVRPIPNQAGSHSQVGSHTVPGFSEASGRVVVTRACMLATVLKMLPFGENVKVLFGVSLICGVSYMPFALQGEQSRQAKDALCAC